MALPQSYKALVQETYAESLTVKTLPLPNPTPGSALVRILYAPVISYMRDVYNGKRSYAYPNPLGPGTNAIGRIAAVGSDAVSLNPGDLVLFDCTVRARDDPSAIILMGLSEGSSAESQKLIAGEWRYSTFAEYAKLPLENLYVLDEKRLCAPLEQGGRGLSLAQMAWSAALVPLGGLRDIGIQPGETIVVSPATGGFGSAGVYIALALGARVIAMGRDVEKLARLREAGKGRVETVQMTGSFEAETAALKALGPVDAVLDLTPAAAQQSTHLKSAILCLRHGGRVALMGGPRDDVAIPYRFIMRHDIRLFGKWMYDRDDIEAYLRMVYMGLFDLRELVKVAPAYKLEQWEEAMETAFNAPFDEMVLFEP